jgi:hypothetical protein
MKLNHRFPARHEDSLCKTLYENEEVAGVQYRIENAMKFASGSDRHLEFELEPGNQHDPNAIKVIGCFANRWGKECRLHIGYVPRHMAKRLKVRRLNQHAAPVLRNIWWGGYRRDVIYIRFDIIGPTKKGVEEYGLDWSASYSQPVKKDEHNPAFDFGEDDRPLKGTKSTFRDLLEWLGMASTRAGKIAWRNAVTLFWLACVFAKQAFRWCGKFLDDLARDVVSYEERQPSALSLITRLGGFAVAIMVLIIVVVKLVR